MAKSKENTTRNDRGFGERKGPDIKASDRINNLRLGGSIFGEDGDFTGEASTPRETTELERKRDTNVSIRPEINYLLIFFFNFKSNNR